MSATLCATLRTIPLGPLGRMVVYGEPAELLAKVLEVGSCAGCHLHLATILWSIVDHRAHLLAYLTTKVVKNFAHCLYNADYGGAQLMLVLPHRGKPCQVLAAPW